MQAIPEREETVRIASPDLRQLRRDFLDAVHQEGLPDGDEMFAPPQASDEQPAQEKDLQHQQKYERDRSRARPPRHRNDKIRIGNVSQH